MKQFMTLSAFFLSAACLSVHTPSFAYLFDDISRGAEKATRGLMNTGSHHHRSHRAAPDDAIPVQTLPAPITYGAQYGAPLVTDPAAPTVGTDPLPATTPTASTAASDTSPPAVQPPPAVQQPPAQGHNAAAPITKATPSRSPMPLTYEHGQ